MGDKGVTDPAPGHRLKGSEGIGLAFSRFIIASLPVGILTVNPQMKVTSFNPWAESLTGYSEKEAIGRYCGDILQGGMCKLNCPLRTAIAEQVPIVRMETTIQNKAGVTLPVRMHTAALLDNKKGILGAVEAFQDISFLKTLEREKNNIVSMFAHDMKSSLTIIGGFALRLLKNSGALGEEKSLRYLEIIQKETRKLDFMIHDFLEFSRLQTGELKLSFQETPIDTELAELAEAYQAKAHQSGVSLEFHSDGKPSVIAADPNRLRRVFTNLLDNAMKYSKAGGSVRLSKQEAARDVIITVDDGGEGIDPEDLPYIFEIFHRGKSAAGKGGAGVGLASVKAIVEGHGGRVSVESTPGKGSTFTVALPKSSPQETP